MNYDQIRALSEELGRPISTLIVLDQYNDPFYIGPRRKERAEWFAQIWHDLKIPIGWHYRRIHYRMISQDPPLRFHPEGVYQNTMECWVALNNAARDAVYLGLVPLDAFVDRRNPEPFLYVEHLIEPNIPGVTGDDPWLASVRFGLPGLPDYLELFSGTMPQPYHVEL